MQRNGYDVCRSCGVPFPDTEPPCRFCPATPIENPSEDSEWYPCGFCEKPVKERGSSSCWRCVARRRLQTVKCDVPRHGGDRKQPAYMCESAFWLTHKTKQRRDGMACRTCVGRGWATLVERDSLPPIQLAHTEPKLQEWQGYGYLAGEFVEKGKRTPNFAYGKHKLEQTFVMEWTHARINTVDCDGFSGALLVGYRRLRAECYDVEELSGYVMLVGNGVRLYCKQYDSQAAMYSENPEAMTSPYDRTIPERFALAMPRR